MVNPNRIRLEKAGAMKDLEDPSDGRGRNIRRRRWGRQQGRPFRFTLDVVEGLEDVRKALPRDCEEYQQESD